MAAPKGCGAPQRGVWGANQIVPPSNFHQEINWIRRCDEPSAQRGVGGRMKSSHDATDLHRRPIGGLRPALVPQNQLRDRRPELVGAGLLQGVPAAFELHDPGP